MLPTMATSKHEKLWNNLYEMLMGRGILIMQKGGLQKPSSRCTLSGTGVTTLQFVLVRDDEAVRAVEVDKVRKPRHHFQLLGLGLHLAILWHQHLPQPLAKPAPLLPKLLRCSPLLPTFPRCMLLRCKLL